MGRPNTTCVLLPLTSSLYAKSFFTFCGLSFAKEGRNYLFNEFPNCEAGVLAHRLLTSPEVSSFMVRQNNLLVCCFLVDSQKLNKAASKYNQMDIEALLNNEKASGEDKKDPSGTIGVLWLQRGIEFLLEFFHTFLANPKSDTTSMMQSAYERTLKRHHPWITQKTFTFHLHKIAVSRKGIFHLDRNLGQF
ncbi:unnamed protein product [Schistocephalus solidus]|uniref:GLTP domain-containing protein n=1 Tax=Schistocephalus solidus TaxID=70667 RepID=A0A183SKP3_SCHSO|nr:unnamed protein product [Schistocephalus solidus]